MNNKAMYSDNQNNLEMTVEQDLKEALLYADGVSYLWKTDETLPETLIEGIISVQEDPNARIHYPWNLAEPDTAEFFTQSDRESVFTGWQMNEISTRAQKFFGNLDALWLVTALQARFGVRMPQSLLTTIAQQAQAVVATSQELADQLVQCAQTVLPNLAEDDLRVLARPLAYAKHMLSAADTKAIESTLSAVRPIEWQNLSDIEQARLSLVVARCAIAELEATDKD